MPQELVDKIVTARTFNQGYATTEYLSAALLDLAWHTLPAGEAKQDVDAFEKQALEKYKVDLGAEVLDHDAFQWFRENGGLTRENGQIFRDRILSIGHSRDLAVAYREFRGKEPSVEPLLEHRGLK